MRPYQGDLVSVDEWKSILISRLTSAISKVAASPNLPHIQHQATVQLATTKRPLPDLGILDDSYYNQDFGKRNGNVVVNVWDSIRGALTPGFFQKIYLSVNRPLHQLREGS